MCLQSTFECVYVSTGVRGFSLLLVASILSSFHLSSHLLTSLPSQPALSRPPRDGARDWEGRGGEERGGEDWEGREKRRVTPATDARRLEGDAPGLVA